MNKHLCHAPFWTLLLDPSPSNPRHDRVFGILWKIEKQSYLLLSPPSLLGGLEEKDKLMPLLSFFRCQNKHNYH